MAAAAGSMVIFVTIYEGVRAIRFCSLILGQLLLVDDDQVSLMRMTIRERKAVMMKARSLRPVSLPLGCFPSFSVNNMWNLAKEIVSHVLLLTTL